MGQNLKRKEVVILKTKFSVGLSALMVLLITGSAFADATYEDAKTITGSGTYNFKAGKYNGKLIDINGTQDVTATINIENNGTLTIDGSDSSSIISAAAGVNRKNDITINGNLAVGNYTFNTDSSYDTDIFFLFGNVKFNVKNNISIEDIDVNTTTKLIRIGVMRYSSGADAIGEFVLGTDNSNTVNIKNIHLKSTNLPLVINVISNCNNNSNLTLNGKTTIDNITADSQNGMIYFHALESEYGANIFVNGDLKIANLKASTSAESQVAAIHAGMGGKIYVNPNKNRNVQIDGDIVTGDRYYNPNTADNLIQINLSDTNSSIHGAIDGAVDLNMVEGSVWKVKQGVSKETLMGRELSTPNHYLNSLTGSGIIEMYIDASKNTDNQHLFVQNLEGTHTLKLNNTSSSDISGAEGNVLVTANGSGKLIAPASEGSLYWTKYELATNESETKNEKTGEKYQTDWYLKTTTKTPIKPDEPSDPSKPSDPSEPSKPSTPPHYTTSVSTLLSTITAGYDTWRSDTDKLNERLGELRLNGKAAEGVWVRTKGSQFGRHGGNGSYTNQQHTYQLGYDAVTSQNAQQTTYTGFAAEYGKGNLSFDRGTGTMKSAGLGLYQTQLRESGHYLDFVYKFDKYKNDFHVADTAGNPISGKYSNNAMSLSAEYGRQNALKHGWYIEPQAELTLGYMWGNDFTTSNSIRVEQKNMPALIGRLGLNIGRSVSDKVNFYVKANINHDFLGKYDLQMTDLTNGDRLNASDKFASSWFDYGAGFTVRTSNNSYAYFDIERAVGGEYKKNWDWNVGLRLSF